MGKSGQFWLSLPSFRGLGLGDRANRIWLVDRESGRAQFLHQRGRGFPSVRIGAAGAQFAVGVLDPGRRALPRFQVHRHDLHAVARKSADALGLIAQHFLDLSSQICRCARADRAAFPRSVAHACGLKLTRARKLFVFAPPFRNRILENHFGRDPGDGHLAMIESSNAEQIITTALRDSAAPALDAALFSNAAADARRRVPQRCGKMVRSRWTNASAAAK
jgi:hypothetical protein